MPGDVHSWSSVKHRAPAHNNNAGVRHEVTLAIVIQIESNARTSGNANTFFNNGISYVRILVDAHALHKYGGLHVPTIINLNSRREDGMAYTTTGLEARTDVRRIPVTR
jgi:hypothetical protein